MNLDKNRPVIFLFSHPNHEVAAFGMIYRLRPIKLIYLTDGGGEHRVNETKAVLTKIGLAENAVFLNRREDSFYNALLDLDCGYFEALSGTIRDLLIGFVAPYIFCDAVEFYNPVHDMTLPIAKSLGRFSTIFEIPLAYEDTNGNTFVQKPPNVSGPDAISVPLNKEEKRLKEYFLQTVYRSLGEQMDLLIKFDASLIEGEWFLTDRGWPISPKCGQVIRYDARGKKLVSEKAYARNITHEGNYVPLTTEFLRRGV